MKTSKKVIQVKHCNRCPFYQQVSDEMRAYCGIEGFFVEVDTASPYDKLFDIPERCPLRKGSSETSHKAPGSSKTRKTVIKLAKDAKIWP